MTFEGDRWWLCGCPLAGISSTAAVLAADTGTAATRLAVALCSAPRPPLMEASAGLGVVGRCGDPSLLRRCASAAASRSHLDSYTCVHLEACRGIMDMQPKHGQSQIRARLEAALLLAWRLQVLLDTCQCLATASRHSLTGT